MLLLIVALGGRPAGRRPSKSAPEWLEDLHEGVANAMLALVVVHVGGGTVEHPALHRENLVRAMVTGYKPGQGPGRGGDAVGRGAAAHWRHRRVLGGRDPGARHRTGPVAGAGGREAGSARRCGA